MRDGSGDRDGAISTTAGWSVYQCANGCMHVRLNQVTLTFSAGEFAQLAQMIGDAYVRLCVRAAVATARPH